MAGTSNQTICIPLLPDEAIEHVFSFLPTRDVVKTSLLSKRWRSYWKTVPNLRFSVSTYRDDPSGDRFRFVNWVLARYQRKKVQTFHLVLRSEFSDHLTIDSWLQFAINHEVEELLIDLEIEYIRISSTTFIWWGGHILSPWFCDCSSLTRLSLRGGRFSLSYCESVCWSSLKSLSIEGVRDEVLRKILLGSPVLEYLTLEWPSGVEEIRSASLKELVIVAYSTSPMHISTPRLLSLRVRLDHFRDIIRIVEAPSLLEAELDFHGPTESDFCLLKEMLCELQNVTRILFGAWFCWVMRPLKVEDVQVSLPNCKSLTLHVPIPGFSFPAIANMLATTPNLEKLVIIFKPYDRNSVSSPNSNSQNISDLDSCHVDPQSYWHIKKKSKHWARHLKNVEIFGFYDCLRDKYEEVLTLVRFLLGHAFLLESMVIKVMKGSQHLEVVSLDKLHEVARQLKCYHRASKHAAVILNYLEEEHGKRQKKGVRVTTKCMHIGRKDA